MNRKTAALVAILVVASLIPLGAAETLGERNRRVVQRYQDARANYQRNVDAYEKARQDFLTAQQRFRRYRRANDSNETFQRAKDFLLRADEAMIGHIEVVKARVDSSEVLSEEDKQDILDELDGYITWLEDKQPEIEAATTKEELVDIAQAVRDKWLEIRGSVKKIAGLMLSAKIDRILERGENVSARVDARIQELKEKGVDTSELEALLDDFNEKLDLAKEKNEAAKEKFREIEDIKDADQLLREGHEFIKEANSYLREAYSDLRDIVREMRSLNSAEEGE